VNDEAESWMVVLETLKGLGQQRAKALSTGRTLAVSKPCLWRKCGIKQGNCVFASAAYQALIEVQHAGEAGVVQLIDVVPTIIVCYTTGYRKRHLQGFQRIITP